MTQILIVSGISWTVPTDWNSANNSIETIGGGGGGTSSGGNDGGGGGGGAYSKIINLVLTPGANVSLHVGLGGAANIDGSDTWFNGTSLSASSIGAKGGSAALGPPGGEGGNQAGGIGTIKFSGGDGGTSANLLNGGAGGGGAAGPNGAGKAGGPSTHHAGSGGGGAGGGSSTAGSDSSEGSVGGQGGTTPDGSAGGAGAIDEAANAGVGSHGSGGGGGAFGSLPYTNGAAGGDGIEWSSAGAGGGGGGGGYGSFNSGSGGSGGNYGGGGGGSGYLGPSGGSGAQGVIVISYTSATSDSVIADAVIPLELPATAFRYNFDPIQFLSSTRKDAELSAEWLGLFCHAALVPTELTGILRGLAAVDTEWSGALAVTVAELLRMEWIGALCTVGNGVLESTGRSFQGTNSPAEWLALSKADRRAGLEYLAAIVGNSGSVSEFAGRVANDLDLRAEGLCSLISDAGLRLASIAVFHRDALSGIELLTSGVRVLASGLLLVEWADPPDLMAVSADRLLSSPGRIRIFAGPDSRHPTRGQ